MPDKLAQRGELRGGLVAVRRVERPAQPRHRVEADAGFEGRPHDAQALQGGDVEHAVTACGAGHRPHQAAQQVIAHDMHAHPGVMGQLRHRVGTHRTPPRSHPAQQESCFTSLLKVCAASFSPSTIVRYGNNWSASACTVIRWRIANAAV